MSTAPDNVEVLPGPDHPRFDGEFQAAIAKEAGIPVSEAKPVIQQAPVVPEIKEEKHEQVEAEVEQIKAGERTIATRLEDLQVGLTSDVVGLFGGDKKTVRSTEAAGFLAVKLEREQAKQPDKVVTMEEDK